MEFISIHTCDASLDDGKGALQKNSTMTNCTVEFKNESLMSRG
jgi:hypothetical protein